ncbi:MAG TPA: hypothetical protein VE998_06375 [Terriglobales bacterium]|nr:hypothetical protein [Terriglobales bacterium]
MVRTGDGSGYQIECAGGWDFLSFCECAVCCCFWHHEWLRLEALDVCRVADGFRLAAWPGPVACFDFSCCYPALDGSRAGLQCGGGFCDGGPL